MSWQRTSSRAYGRTVAIYARSLDDVTLPWWWEHEELDHDTHVAIDPAFDDPDEMVRGLEFWVAEHAVDAVFIHAGVVSIDGRVLLLPGRSLAGKTSLTAALLRAGASYGSDEYAVITPDGLIHPYPRRLTVRTDEGPVRVAPDVYGPGLMTEPLPLAGVADLQFAQAGQWEVAEMARSQTILRLLDNAVAAQTRPTAVLDALTAATLTQTVGVQGVRGDADDAAAELIRLFA